MVITLSLHAFVDESRRNDRYLLAVAIINPGDLVRLRKLLRSLLLPGQKELHFKKEEPRRRKVILSRLVQCDPVVHIYQCRCADGEERARQECLTALVLNLVALGVVRLVLDSREVRDQHDRQTIWAVLGKESAASVFTHKHMSSTQEPLLWVADVVAWCYGAGGEWKRRAMPLVAKEVDLDTWSG